MRRMRHRGARLVSPVPAVPAAAGMATAPHSPTMRTVWTLPGPRQRRARTRRRAAARTRAASASRTSAGCWRSVCRWKPGMPTGPGGRGGAQSGASAPLPAAGSAPGMFPTPRCPGPICPPAAMRVNAGPSMWWYLRARFLLWLRDVRRRTRGGQDHRRGDCVCATGGRGLRARPGGAGGLRQRAPMRRARMATGDRRPPRELSTRSSPCAHAWRAAPWPAPPGPCRQATAGSARTSRRCGIATGVARGVSGLWSQFLGGGLAGEGLADGVDLGEHPGLVVIAGRGHGLVDPDHRDARVLGGLPDGDGE